jgi:hypothetical protein
MGDTDPSIEELADGMGLWEEHRPQTGDDWRGVAQRTLADDADTSNASPIFAGLVAAEAALASERALRERTEQERDDYRGLFLAGENERDRLREALAGLLTYSRDATSHEAEGEREAANLARSALTQVAGDGQEETG